MISDLCFLERGKGLSVGLLSQSFRVLLQGHVRIRRPAGVGVCRALKCTMSLHKDEEVKKRADDHGSTLGGSKNRSRLSELGLVWVYV